MSGNSIWDGKITNMQISAESHPELFAELAQLKPKERSTRLRLLAFLGWFCINQSGGQPAAPLPPAHNPVGETDPSMVESSNKVARSTLGEKLLGSVSPGP